METRIDHSYTSSKQISLLTLIFISGLLLAALMVFGPKEDVAPFFIFLIGIPTALVIAILLEPQDVKTLLLLFLLAFLIRCFLSLLFFLLSYTEIGTGPGFLLPGDGFNYHLNALEITKYHLMGIPLTPEALLRIKILYAGTLTNYSFWNANIYYHLGNSPLSMFFILSFLGSLTTLFVYPLAKGIFNKKVAFWSSLMSAFWPSLILWPAQNLKDPLICFGIVLFFYSFVNLIKKFNPLFLLPIMISIFILWKISPWILLPVIFVIGVSLFMNFTGMSIAPLVLGAILIILPLFMFLPMVAELSPLVSRSLSFDTINYLRSVRASGNLAILPNFDISSPINALAFLPIGLIYSWFAPFPWQVGSSSQIIAIPEMILFYFLFPNLVRGVAFSWRQRKKETSAIILFIILLSLILAFIDGNAGTLFRHRSYILYFCFVFISVGGFKKELVRKEI